MKFKYVYIDESGDLGKNGTTTEPESTETHTSEYADFQVLPVIVFNKSDNINLSVISKDVADTFTTTFKREKTPQVETGGQKGGQKGGQMLPERQKEIIELIKQNKLITREETNQKTVEKTVEKILSLIKENPKITQNELMDKTGLTRRGIEWNIQNLKNKKILRRVGPDKGGHWEIIK